MISTIKLINEKIAFIYTCRDLNLEVELDRNEI